MLKILSIGSIKGLSNTCTQRNWALQKIGQVDNVCTNEKPMSLWGRIAYHLWLYGINISIPENSDENRQIKDLVDKTDYDIIWIDKGVTISPNTLQYIKKKPTWGGVIISYSPDNMALRHNLSKQYVECIPLYDYLVTTKSYTVDDLKALGARNVLFVNNTFEPTFHYPRELSESDYTRLRADVGFVGAWEEERCKSILYLVDHGVKVRVFGNEKWREYMDYSPNLQVEIGGLYNEDYAKSFKAFKISPCFLRKMNYDQQTSRSIEIPACGGFMVAERTEEHMNLFEEGKEAVFFSSDVELLEKCKYYLEHEEERKKIAEAGTKRCETSGYSNEKMIRGVLAKVFKRQI